MTDVARDWARRQIDAAEHGHAHNQCPHCRRYRTDGMRPQPADHAGSCMYTAQPPPIHDRSPQ